MIYTFNSVVANIPCFNSNYELIFLSKPKFIVFKIKEVNSFDLIKKTTNFYNYVGAAREWKKYMEVLYEGNIFTVDKEYLIEI